eukprot:TRINITY_DN1948_c0_g1_i1.p2 TRINITY_DN1948_c0_g1~~TRINITY_DN1948_c0_g1_i1.p2  ORF type:complete len:166 (-),score=54.15 TRINITY_DN1948_c0_g1_i1:88-585(-)
MQRLSFVSELKDEEVFELDTLVELEREVRRRLELPETSRLFQDAKVPEKQKDPPLIPQLSIASAGPLFQDSKVIDVVEEQNLVVGWLKEARGEGKMNNKLLFRGTRDGFSAKDFHSRCDSQGSTIVLFKTSEGQRGGGYSAQQWFSSSFYGGELLVDTAAFLTRR